MQHTLTGFFDVDNLQRINKSAIKKAVKASCSLILFGAGAEELASLAKAAGYPGELLQCPELESAVNLAETAVQRHQASSLLLSPACASFDQYRDFEARGEHFRSLITPRLDVA